MHVGARAKAWWSLPVNSRWGSPSHRGLPKSPCSPMISDTSICSQFFLCQRCCRAHAWRFYDGSNASTGLSICLKLAAQAFWKVGDVASPTKELGDHSSSQRRWPFPTTAKIAERRPWHRGWCLGLNMGWRSTVSGLMISKTGKPVLIGGWNSCELTLRG